MTPFGKCDASGKRESDKQDEKCPSPFSNQREIVSRRKNRSFGNKPQNDGMPE